MGLVQGRTKFKAQSFVRYVERSYILMLLYAADLLRFLLWEKAVHKEKGWKLNGTASDVGPLYVTDVSMNVIRPDLAALRHTDKLHSSSLIYVEGFDTTLPRDDIKSALAKLFSSCGEITEVSVVGDCMAFVYLMGEGVKEKAVQLSGIDMGGRTLTVGAVKPPIRVTDQIKDRCTRVAVSGYDISLREDVIEAALYNHFASCGDIFDVTFTRNHGTGSEEALVFLEKEGAAEKALQLDGSIMGGRKLVVVVQALPVPEQAIIPRVLHGSRVVYGLPPSFYRKRAAEMTTESSSFLS